MVNSDKHSAILLICCPDSKGIVASVTDFIFTNGGNILDLEQHVNISENMFFMRVEWSLDGFGIPSGEIGNIFGREIAKSFGMNWSLHFSEQVSRMAIFVSKLSHCLYDILSRISSGEWNVEVPLIVSNHDDLRGVAETFGIDYHYFENVKDNKEKVEKQQLELLEKYDVDFVVLARYMQILTDRFISNYPDRIINIHHSFLPAFPGARPYNSAHQRGVKIIGATSHYATAELDAGPIIEQDVARVTHRDTVGDLVRKGRDLEKMVLSRAIWSHINRNILVYKNRTVVFRG